MDRAIHQALGIGADLGRVTRFLAGRARFAPRPDDVYIATYPRSGTTWVHTMTYLLTHDLDTEFDHISMVAPWWERTLAHQDDGAERLAALPGPRVFKTHARREWLPRTGRCIYVVRNSADVARSYYRLYVTHLGYRGGFESFLEALLDGRLQYGRHADHVASWARHRERVLWLAYEEIYRDPRAALRRIAEFLDVSADESTLNAVAEATSIEQMRAQAFKYDHGGEVLYQRGLLREGFIGQGGVGCAELTANHRSLLATQPARVRPEWRLDKYLR